MFITTMQILQIIGGVLITINCLYYCMIEKAGGYYFYKETNVASSFNSWEQFILVFLSIF